MPPARTAARVSGDLRPWRLRTAARRSGTQWRLLAVVAAVSVTVATLLSALGVLLVATEGQGVRTAFARADDARTSLRVTAQTLTVPVADARAAADDAVAALVAPATPEGSGSEQSAFQRVARAGDVPAIVYLGHVDGVEEITDLVDGAWPTDAPTGGGGAMPVAIPESMAQDLGLAVGSRVVASGVLDLDAELTAEVVGVYAVRQPVAPAWSTDALDGATHDPEFAVPGTAGSLRTDAYGPLLVATGALDAAGVPVDRLVVTYRADLDRKSVV